MRDPSALHVTYWYVRAEVRHTHLQIEFDRGLATFNSTYSQAWPQNPPSRRAVYSDHEPAMG